jgi:hypothetical protein
MQAKSLGVTRVTLRAANRVGLARTAARIAGESARSALYSKDRGRLFVGMLCGFS